MTPAAAMKLLQSQPAKVRKAVEAVLLSVDDRAWRLFGARLARGLADEIQGRQPTEAAGPVLATFTEE